MTCRAAGAAGSRIPGGGGAEQANTCRPGCQRRAPDFPATARPLNIRGMSMLQIILLIALIALIAFWFFMRKKGA